MLANSLSFRNRLPTGFAHSTCAFVAPIDRFLQVTCFAGVVDARLVQICGQYFR